MKPGKFKDEWAGIFILEWVGLRAKMYSMLPLHGDKKATAKGVSQRIIRDVLKHQDYKACLMDSVEMNNDMIKIGHQHHQLQTQQTRKKSLSPFNDKKWISKDGSTFTTYSFGHYRIEGEVKLGYY